MRNWLINVMISSDYGFQFVIFRAKEPLYIAISDTYLSSKNCEEGARTCLDILERGRYKLRKEQENDKWYFEVIARNHKKIFKSRLFNSWAEMETFWNAVKEMNSENTIIFNCEKDLVSKEIKIDPSVVGFLYSLDGVIPNPEYDSDGKAILYGLWEDDEFILWKNEELREKLLKPLLNL